MKNLLFSILLLFSCPMFAQLDSTRIKQINALEQKTIYLQSQIDAIADSHEKFSQINNIAGLMFLAGLGLAGINLGSDEPDDALFYVAGGLVLTGTVVLYFSGNKLKINRGYKSYKHANLVY